MRRARRSPARETPSPVAPCRRLCPMAGRQIPRNRVPQNSVLSQYLRDVRHLVQPKRHIDAAAGSFRPRVRRNVRAIRSGRRGHILRRAALPLMNRLHRNMPVMADAKHHTGNTMNQHRTREQEYGRLSNRSGKSLHHLRHSSRFRAKHKQQDVSPLPAGVDYNRVASTASLAGNSFLVRETPYTVGTEPDPPETAVERPRSTLEG